MEIHVARPIEEPLDVDVGQLGFYSIDDVESRAGSSIEDTAQCSGCLLEEIGEDRLGHVLVLHDQLNPVFQFHFLLFRAKMPVFV